MENAIFSAGSDPKPPFHGGGRSRKVSLRFEKSALFRSHGRCWLRSIKHWKTHACFFRLNYNHICLSKKLHHLIITFANIGDYSFRDGFCDFCCCLFRPIPKSQLEVFCVKTLKTPRMVTLTPLGVSSNFNTPSFCNYEALHGFTICVWLPTPSCWILTFS